MSADSRTDAAVVRRCAWPKDELNRLYHDTEWGVPQHDDRMLFEHLVLGGAQAGLSWAIVLRKRESYRKAFAGLEPQKVARFNARKVESLLKNPGIIRNRQKIASAVKNARAFVAMQEEFGSFDTWLWRFVDGKPIVNRRRSLKDLPTRTPLSDRISEELKVRGFSFVGTTIIYAVLQAVGVINDHTLDCFRHAELS